MRISESESKYSPEERRTVGIHKETAWEKFLRHLKISSCHGLLILKFLPFKETKE